MEIRAANPVEDIFAANRPETMPSRRASVSMVMRIMDYSLINQNSVPEKYMYEVEPQGMVTKLDWGWVYKAEAIYKRGYNLLSNKDKIKITRFAQAYWAGKTSDESVWEFFAPRAVVTRPGVDF